MTHWSQHLIQMHRALTDKVRLLLLVLLITVTCVSCKRNDDYLIKDYLSDLSEVTGLEREGEDDFLPLVDWGVIDREDLEISGEALNYGFMTSTLCRFLKEDISVSYLLDKGIYVKDIKAQDRVRKKDAEQILERFVKVLNEAVFERKREYDTKEYTDVYTYLKEGEDYVIKEDLEKGDLVYLRNENGFKKVVSGEGNAYRLKDADFEEVFEYLRLSDSQEIDFSNSTVIPYGQDATSSYAGSGIKLLGFGTGRKVFNNDGYRISYSISGSGIEFRVSKEKNPGLDIYYDVSLKNIKPVYNFVYENHKLEEAFFKVDYSSTQKFGVQNSKFDKKYSYFRDLKDKSFKESLKAIFSNDEDTLEDHIRLCEIKTPIKEIPTVFLNMEVALNLYASGKAELVIYDTKSLGFEIKNKRFRLINDSSNQDCDFIIGATSKAALGLNFNIEGAGRRIADIEADAGVKATVSTTLHLYDSEGNLNSEESEVPYAILDYLTSGNSDVKACGDVSFRWLLDIKLNTSRTFLYKLGFTHTFQIMDDRNQIFGNKTHIENWQFVDRCTRRSRKNTSTQNSAKPDVNKIILDRYSIVLAKNSSYLIEVKALPQGYSEKDLVLESSDGNVAGCESLVIKALNSGNSKVRVSTSDGKYETYINVLVSYE